MANITFVMNSENYDKHKAGIKLILGEKSSLPDASSLGELKIDYKIDLNLDSFMLTKLRTLLAIADDESTNFFVENINIADISECLMIIKDLKAIAQERQFKELLKQEVL